MLIQRTAGSSGHPVLRQRLEAAFRGRRRRRKDELYKLKSDGLWRMNPNLTWNGCCSRSRPIRSPHWAASTSIPVEAGCDHPGEWRGVGEDERSGHVHPAPQLSNRRCGRLRSGKLRLGSRLRRASHQIPNALPAQRFRLSRRDPLTGLDRGRRCGNGRRVHDLACRLCSHALDGDLLGRLYARLARSSSGAMISISVDSAAVRPAGSSGASNATSSMPAICSAGIA